MIKIDIKDKNDIIEAIIKKNNLSRKQRINYSEFLRIYEDYKEKYTEEEFAEILEIKRKSFQAFRSKASKNEKKEIIILQNRKISKEEEQRKILELVQRYELKKGQKIDYEFLKKMHDTVKDVLTEQEFSILLGITDVNLRKLRQAGYARIFKNMNLSDELIEKIRRNIIRQYEGKKIYYKENVKNKGDVDFLKLYNPYRLYFTENEFANNILGISDKNLWYSAHGEANPIIKDIEKVKKVEKIKEKIEQNKFYSKEEIEIICKKIGLSQTDFINYYINKAKIFNPTFYEDALEKNGGIYFGKGRVSNEDIEKYQKIIERILRTIIRSLQSKYPKYYIEDDFKSETLEYIIYNCNDLVQNFKYDPKLMERAIWMRANKYTKARVYKKYKEDKNLKSLNEGITKSEEKGFDTVEESIDVVNLNIEDKDDLIELFMYYLGQGYTREEILNDVSKSFIIEKSEILEMMKEYLLEKGKVVQNKKGEYQLGDK